MHKMNALPLRTPTPPAPLLHRAKLVSADCVPPHVPVPPRTQIAAAAAAAAAAAVVVAAVAAVYEGVQCYQVGRTRIEPSERVMAHRMTQSGLDGSTCWRSPSLCYLEIKAVHLAKSSVLDLRYVP